jgi:hypothetical protein
VIFIFELLAACAAGLFVFTLLLSGASSKGVGAPVDRQTRINSMPLPKRQGR